MKKVLFVILCNKEGPVMQIPVPKGKPVTGNFYKNVVIKNLKKWYETCRLKTGVKFLRRMHDKAPSHNERNVTEAEKAFVLPNPLFLQSKPHAFCLKYHLFGKKMPLGLQCISILCLSLLRSMKNVFWCEMIVYKCVSSPRENSVRIRTGTNKIIKDE